MIILANRVGISFLIIVKVEIIINICEAYCINSFMIMLANRVGISFLIIVKVEIIMNICDA